MKVWYILLPGIFMKIFKVPGKVPIGRALSKKQWMLTGGSVKICKEGECKKKLISQVHFAETAGNMSGQKLYLHLPWPPWSYVAIPVKLAAAHFLPESSENPGDLPSSESSTFHTATSASHFEAGEFPTILGITDLLIPSTKAKHFFIRLPMSLFASKWVITVFPYCGTLNCHLLVWPIYQAQWWKL